MKILCIHQNFPGQYKHLAPARVQQGHQGVALTPKVDKAVKWNGVQVVPYKIQGGSTKGIHPWLADFETKILRGQSCYVAAMKLKEQGYSPDVILAHHGWGESMFLKDVWPKARLGLYCELYHLADKEFVGFDPEFPSRQPLLDPIRLRMKNLNNRLHEEVMDAGISPTKFQGGTFPDRYQDRISVIHDGVNTDIVQPNANATLSIENGPTLGRDDEVVTFINRNLEPYRGYHIFMRALPDLLRRRPKAQIVMLGGDEVSYGARAPEGKTWKQIFIDEVRADIPDADWARVHFLGRVPYDRFLSLMQISRVHVYLTYPFVLSWSLLESMAAECAIVASATTPVREVVTHDQNGRLVDFFDRAGLVDQVCDLMEDAAARARLGKAAREFVTANYDLKKVCLPQQLEWVNRLSTLEPRAPIE